MGKRTSWSALCAIISQVAPNLDTASFVCLSASLNRESQGRINQQHLLNLFHLQIKLNFRVRRFIYLFKLVQSNRFSVEFQVSCFGK